MEIKTNLIDMTLYWLYLCYLQNGKYILETEHIFI